jgi:predicted transposase/invertase (TIGR01784 family)
MLGVNLEETKVYQEAKAEGREEGREELKLELVPRMIARGMTIEEVAELLGLAIAQVKQATNN